MTPLEQAESPQEELPESLSSVIEGMQARMGKSADIIYRFISLGPLSAVIIFIEGLSEPRELIQAIHEDANLFHEMDDFHPQTCLKLLQERTLTLGKVGRSATIQKLRMKFCPATPFSSLKGAGWRCLPVQKR